MVCVDYDRCIRLQPQSTLRQQLFRGYIVIVDVVLIGVGGCFREEQRKIYHRI